MRFFKHPHKIALFAGFAVCAVLMVSVAVRSQQTGSITLRGSMAAHCQIAVTPTASATNLDLENGVIRVEIGTVLQNCNKKDGYTLTVASNNCATGTAGAKLIGLTQGEVLPYSVEFSNPATGGSQTTVSNLLSSACSGATVITGRDVTAAKIKDETSHVFVNYTGNADSAADTYEDTLVITMTVK